MIIKMVSGILLSIALFLVAFKNLRSRDPEDKRLGIWYLVLAIVFTIISFITEEWSWIYNPIVR